MKPFMLLATLVVLVHGRPEAGYSYPHPGSGSIGGGHGANLGSTTGGFSSGHFGSGFGSSGHNPGLDTPIASNSIGGSSHIPSFSGSGHGSSFGGSSHGSSFGGSGHNPSFTGPSHGSSFGGSSHGSSFGGSSHGSSFSGSSHGSSFGGPSHGSSFGGSSHGSSYAEHSSGVTVQKHIYVHVPPPEPEEFHPYKQIPVGQAQKHYKIIFIKAPTQATPTAPTIPLQAQNEEKTLVYVLVKKPEDQPEITIPTAAPTQPSKPEVYFIRYKTQKHHSSASVAGGSIGGGAIGGSQFVGTTGAGSDVGSHHEIHTSGATGSSSVSTNYGPPGQSGPY